MLVGGQALAFWLAWFKIDFSGGPRVYVSSDADAVRKRAIEVTHPRDPSLRFLVMDPVDCLVSRFENLRQIALFRLAGSATGLQAHAKYGLDIVM